MVGRRYLKRTRDAAPKEADLPPGSPTISPSLSGVLRSHHFFFLFFFLVRVKEKGRFLQQLSRGRREVGSDPRSSLNPQRPLAAAPTSLPGCASVFGARITLRARFLVWAIFGGGPNRRFLLQNGSPTLEFHKDFRKYQKNPACFGEGGGDGGDGGGRGKVLWRSRSSARRSLTVSSDPAHPICLSGSGGHSLRRGPDRTTERESLRTHRHCAQGCNRKVVKRERERERERGRAGGKYVEELEQLE